MVFRQTQKRKNLLPTHLPIRCCFFGDGRFHVARSLIGIWDVSTRAHQDLHHRVHLPFAGRKHLVPAALLYGVKWLDGDLQHERQRAPLLEAFAPALSLCGLSPNSDFELNSHFKHRQQYWTHSCPGRALQMSCPLPCFALRALRALRALFQEVHAGSKPLLEWLRAATLPLFQWLGGELRQNTKEPRSCIMQNLCKWQIRFLSNERSTQRNCLRHSRLCNRFALSWGQRHLIRGSEPAESMQGKSWYKTLAAGVAATKQHRQITVDANKCQGLVFQARAKQDRCSNCCCGEKRLERSEKRAERGKKRGEGSGIFKQEKSTRFCLNGLASVLLLPASGNSSGYAVNVASHA